MKQRLVVLEVSILVNEKETAGEVRKQLIQQTYDCFNAIKVAQIHEDLVDQNYEFAK